MTVKEIINNLSLSEEDKWYLHFYFEDFENEVKSVKEFAAECNDTFCEDINEERSMQTLEDLEELSLYLNRYIRILRSFKNIN